MNLLIVNCGVVKASLQKYAGQSDLLLTAKSIATTQALARNFEHVNFRCGFSSDVARAVQTSKIFGEILDITFEYTELLRARSYGLIDGLAKWQAENRYYAEWNRFFLQGDYSAINAESVFDVGSRVEQFLARLEPYPNDIVLIISHTHTIDILIRTLLGIPLDDKIHFMISSHSYSEVIIHNEKVTILRVNCKL